MTPTTHALLICVVFLCGLEETVLSQDKLCTENQCIAIFEEPNDFSSAEQRCKDLGGQLLKAMLTPEQESLITGHNGSYWFDNSKTADKATVGGQNCSSVSGLHVTAQPCQNTLDGFLCQFTLDKKCNARQSGGGAQMRYFSYAGFELDALEMFPNGAIAEERKVGAEYPDTKHICMEEWIKAPWSCEVKNGGCEHDCDSNNKSCSCHAGHILHLNGISCVKDPCADCEQECDKVGNTFVCSCRDGYSLAEDRKNCVVDVCKDRCKGDFQECLPTGTSFECRCKDGYTLAKDGKKCVVDVCKKKKNPCMGNFKVCVNNGENYKCRCKDGYTLAIDGMNCVEDVCKTKENPCPGDLEECVNTGGSYECRCKDGTEKEDGKCLDHSICNDCEHHCEKINGVYKCICKEGFRVSPKDPTKCEMVCTERDCLAYCVPPDNGTQCFCPDGYVHDPRNGTNYCTDIDECEGQKQCPGGVCVNSYGGFSCEENYDDYGPSSSPSPTSNTPDDQPPSVQPAASLPSYVKTGSILGITLFFAMCATLLVCIVRYMFKRCGKLELSSFKGPDMDIFYLQQVTTETYKRLSFDKQIKHDSQIF